MLARAWVVFMTVVIVTFYSFTAWLWFDKALHVDASWAYPNAGRLLCSSIVAALLFVGYFGLKRQWNEWKKLR